jgi:hypothetical protein
VRKHRLAHVWIERISQRPTRSGLEQGKYAKDSKEADGVACDEVLVNDSRKRLKGYKSALQIAA